MNKISHPLQLPFVSILPLVGLLAIAIVIVIVIDVIVVIVIIVIIIDNDSFVAMLLYSCAVIWNSVKPLLLNIYQ